MEEAQGGLTLWTFDSIFRVMKSIAFTLSSVLFAGSLVSCEPHAESVAATAERSGVWIDVRTPEEYASGHLDGALNLPHDAIGKHIAAEVPDKDAEIHLYCRSGRRSGIAKDTLERMGYTRVRNEGGYASLKDR